MRHGALHMILVAYLRSAGWQDEDGRWLAPDAPRKGTKRRERAARYSLMAAVESQTTSEYYARREAEKPVFSEPWIPPRAKAAA